MNYSDLERLNDPDNLKVQCDPELLMDNGYIGEFARYCISSAPYLCWPAITAGSLASTGFFAGQYYVLSTTGVRPRIYCLGLAPSTTGKEYPRQVISGVAFRLGVSNLIVTKIASAQGLEDALLLNHTMLMMLDEIAELISELGRGQSPIAAQLNAFLLAIYSERTLIQRTLSAQNKHAKTFPPVEWPSLSLFGTSTYEKLFARMSNFSLTDGLMGRCLVFAQDDQRKIANSGRYSQIPDGLVEAAGKILKPNGDCYIDTSENVIEADPADTQRLNDIQSQWLDFYNDSRDTVLRAIIGRAHEITSQVALLFALSENRRILNRQDIDRAEALVFQSIATVCKASRQDVAENDYERKVQRLVKIIQKNKALGWRDLLLKVPRAIGPSKFIKALCDDLVAAGQVEWVKSGDKGCEPEQILMSYERGCVIRWKEV